MSEKINELNNIIIDAHKHHYMDNQYGLLQPKESPNGNIMYHLYSSGEITYQKGGWGYLNRNEFWHANKIPYAEENFDFPLKAADNTTYVILTIEECKKFRIMIDELLK